ncbi:MAG TPA: PfkB family carbohydrate kinase [Acidobacteriota bacterium]|nr:PfkB family carbohydrate kinase [Acidobacteriota bacterium]
MSRLNQQQFDVTFPHNRPYSVIGLGLNAVDWICVVPVYPEHNSKIQMEAMYRLGGGQVATACALCARYGLQTRYIGRVGDDDIGAYSLNDLHKEPMDLSVDVVQGAYSQYAVIIVDRLTGERTVMWNRDRRLHYGKGQLKKEKVVQGQVLHIDGYDLPACLEAAKWAREAGMYVSLDIDQVQEGIEKLLKLTDFLIPTLSFVYDFTGVTDWKEGLRKLATFTDGFVAVTLGKEGSACLWEDAVYHVAGFEVDSVDTTGAGDVFHGAFLYSLFQDWNVEDCLRFANAAGALACTRYGARGGIPALEEVEQLLGQQVPLEQKLKQRNWND